MMNQSEKEKEKNKEQRWKKRNYLVMHVRGRSFVLESTVLFHSSETLDSTSFTTTLAMCLSHPFHFLSFFLFFLLFAVFCWLTVLLVWTYLRHKKKLFILFLFHFSVTLRPWNVFFFDLIFSLNNTLLLFLFLLLLYNIFFFLKTVFFSFK